MATFNVVVKGKTVSTVDVDTGDRKGKEALEFATANAGSLPAGAKLRKKHSKPGAGRPPGAKQVAPKKPRKSAAVMQQGTSTAAAVTAGGVAAFFMGVKAYMASKLGLA